MKLLAWLTETFIATFGITRPRPEQQRIAQMVIGGFLLLFLLLVASLVILVLFLARAHPAY